MKIFRFCGGWGVGNAVSSDMISRRKQMPSPENAQGDGGRGGHRITVGQLCQHNSMWGTG